MQSNPSLLDVLKGIGALQEGQTRLDRLMAAVQGTVDGLRQEFAQTQTQTALLQQQQLNLDRRMQLVEAQGLEGASHRQWIAGALKTLGALIGLLLTASGLAMTLIRMLN